MSKKSNQNGFEPTKVALAVATLSASVLLLFAIIGHIGTM